MTDKFNEAITTLLSEGYLVSGDTGIFFTEKFADFLSGADPTDYQVRSVTMIDPVTKTSIVPAGNARSPLVELIIGCKVPAKARLGDGKAYWVNKYSKQAEKELAAILDKGYQLDILKAVVTLYYKAGGCVETITNFIVNGTWLMHYIEMEKHVKAGTEQKYIATTLGESETSASPMYGTR